MNENFDPRKVSEVSDKDIENVIRPRDFKNFSGQDKILENLKKTPKKPALSVEDFEFDKKDISSFEITRHDDGSFEVTGGRVDNLVRGVVLSNTPSFAYFQTRLKDMGVIDSLIAKGMKNGDTVIIKDISFVYEE